jgi:hypothetical protein
MDRPKKQNESAEEGAIKVGKEANQGGRVVNKDNDSSGGGLRGGSIDPRLGPGGPSVRLRWMNPFQQLVDSGQFDDYLRGEFCLGACFEFWGSPWEFDDLFGFFIAS